MRKINRDTLVEGSAAAAVEPQIKESALETVFANSGIAEETTEIENETIEETTEMLGLDCQDEVETEAEEDGLDITEETVEEAVADELENDVMNYAPKKIGDTSKRNRNAKEVAEGYGAEFVSGNIVYAGVGSMIGNRIRVEHLYQRKNAQRVYQITEETAAGEISGRYSKKSIFSCGEIVAKSRRIESYISAFVDDYTIDINNITLILQIIEKNRLLKVTKRGTVDTEVLTTEQILKRLVQFMKNCISDERLAVIEMNGLIRAGIVGRGTKTAYQNFRSLINELAPENDVKIFKDDIYNKNLLIHDNSTDCNDSGLTVSSKWINELGIRGDKMYAFRFSENELKEIKEAHEKLYSKSKELKAGESNGVS